LVLRHTALGQSTERIFRFIRRFHKLELIRREHE
jgi:hypothetical protein